MKTLKKLLTVFIVFTMATASYAQTFGVKAGLNLSNMEIKGDDFSDFDDSKMIPGFHLGGIVEFPISDIFSFETGLLLSTKGFKLNEKENNSEYKIKMNSFYLDIPLTAKASFDVGDAKVYGVLGPYLGIGLSGKIKSEYSYEGETETDEEEIKWGSDEDEDDLKRLDFGLTMGAGVEINSIIFELSYDLGLANIATITDYGLTINNRVFKISAGYKFGGK